MFQMCSTFGVCLELRTKVAFHFECTFGTVLESKCATHLEHESATCGGCSDRCENFGFRAICFLEPSIAW